MSRTSEPMDPLLQWSEWLDKAERQFNDVMNEMMASDTFGRAQSRMMESMLKMQASLNQATHRYFTVLNLPTRTDVLGLAEQLTEIQERLSALEVAVSSQASRPAGAERSASRPRRTKKAASKKKPAAKKKKAQSSKKKASKKKTKKKSTKKKS